MLKYAKVEGTAQSRTFFLRSTKFLLPLFISRQKLFFSTLIATNLWKDMRNCDNCFHSTGEWKGMKIRTEEKKSNKKEQEKKIINRVPNKERTKFERNKKMIVRLGWRIEFAFLFVRLVYLQSEMTDFNRRWHNVILRLEYIQL